MDVFEKATKAVKEVGGNVIDSAKSIGNSIYSTSKEQRELAGMKVQKSVIEKHLNDGYAKIGKRYVEYMSTSDGSEEFDISDILEEMNPDLEKFEEITSALKEKEEFIKQEEQEKQRKKAEEEFETAKEKLDRALEMEIVSKEEYEEKMEILQKKYDNYDELKRFEAQLDMGIITKEEYNAKVKKVLASES